MPKKINFLGGMQNYDADTGKYEPALQGPNGESPSSFKSFKKDSKKTDGVEKTETAKPKNELKEPKQDFKSVNEKRMGVKKETDVEDDQINEALGDYTYLIGSKTTAGQYAEKIAGIVGTSKEKVFDIIKQQAPEEIDEYSNMADIMEAFENGEEYIDKDTFNYNYEAAKQLNNYENAEKLKNILTEKYGENHSSVKGVQKALDEMKENFDKGENHVENKEGAFDPKKYADVEQTQYGFVYNVNGKSITDVAAQNKKFGVKGKSSGFTVTTDDGDEAFYETFDEAYKAAKGNKTNEPKEKSLNDYTDELFKKTNLTTFNSKKYKNQNGEIVEIRRFGEGKNAIRYNETTKQVEQVWVDGERVK